MDSNAKSDLSVTPGPDPECTRPAITTYDPRLVRHRPGLIPRELPGGRDFRSMVLRDNFPIPADLFREGYCSGDDISYWLQGLADFLRVIQVAEDLEVSPGTVLDFGCATGRVTRHFCNQLDHVSVWGCDINPEHIAWLEKHIPRRIRAIQCSGPAGLPIADNSIDLVCAFSVFTHIDEDESRWLEELRRILRPGGMCYFTAHNEDTWTALSELDPANRLVRSMTDTGEVSIEQLREPMPEERLVYQFLGDESYRYQVFHSNSYLRREWGKRFNIRSITSRAHHRQAVVVMTKPVA